MGEESIERIERISKVLRMEFTGGLTITELVRNSKLSRHIVLKTLAQLEGADKVSIRNAGMAKIYSLREKKK